ncbi:transketolase, partial [Marivirga lumbricoides]
GASFEKTLINLGADSKNPFLVPQEVTEYYQSILERKRKEAASKKEEELTWRKDNPDLADKLDLFLSGKTPPIDYSTIIQKANSASRDASSVVLAELADNVENLIVASADLSNSDKTDGFLKKTTSFKYHDYSGHFLQAGVAEFSMAALANGMALHGGVIPVVGTFFIFSDYQKPALRLSALMELPVIYLWTHDA